MIVVFFGDHQPFFPSTYNDLWFTDEDEAIHQERLWQTNYIIWANYDVAGNTQANQNDEMSTNYLGAELMQLIGARADRLPEGACDAARCAARYQHDRLRGFREAVVPGER